MSKAMRILFLAACGLILSQEIPAPEPIPDMPIGFQYNGGRWLQNAVCYIESGPEQ